MRLPHPLIPQAGFGVGRRGRGAEGVEGREASERAGGGAGLGGDGVGLCVVGIDHSDFMLCCGSITRSDILCCRSLTSIVL